MRGVERFIALGELGQARGGTDASQGLLRYGAAALGKRPADAIVGDWGKGLAVYLSVDLSVPMPGYAKPGACRPVHGLALHELKTLIVALGAAHRIVAIDLVESGASELKTAMACHLALIAMSAAHIPGKSDADPAA
ncbi:arginase family protein [Xanthomonas theicola]|uniref:Arginase n=1 Tax=Xanthomonas theicola TaxID=56464 RepID=A0A2S6ZJP5_9XANT|nr:arginase family protein [Xanthomonas theicola]PPT92481.1 hypothetical protein XthCFBP4691_03915 [Xanthomonas theicola]QNH26444.1 hypothetical protein G4Q83_19350 [Xanthomonas theicola]